jgi:hypothetical protein
MPRRTTPAPGARSTSASIGLTAVNGSSAVGGGTFPYVAFADFSTSLLRVAWRAGGVWNAETVDALTGAQYPSITFDGANEPIIAYKSDLGSGARLATGSPLVAIPISTLGRPSLSLLGANPLRAGTTIALSWNAAADGFMRLEAFDASGRAVGRARTVAVQAGVNRLEWAGPARAGLLFLRARDASGATATVRAVIL